MSVTYLGTLLNDHIDWDGARPDTLTNGEPLRVQVTILANGEPAADQGRKMASILEKLAQLPTMAAIADPGAWQREQRRDRSIPGREN